MPIFNGGRIGSNNDPTTSLASGLWTGLEQCDAVRREIWPVSIVTDGLVLHLDAGNSNSYPGSGTTWTDLSGNGNNGTLTNGPTYDSSNGGSIVFDGNNDYVNLGDLDLPASFTLSIWFKGNTTQPQQFCGLLNKSGNGFGAWGLYGDANSSYVRFGFINTSNSLREISNTNFNDIKANTWVNYVGTYDFSNLRLYRNGVEIASAVETTNPVSTNDTASIGYRVALSANAYAGLVSNAKIYNKALTPSEVTQNFDALKGRYGL